MLKDKTAIRRWVLRYFDVDGTFEVLDDGRVNVFGNISLNAVGRRRVEHFRVVFHAVTGYFCTSDYGRSSTVNFPADECVLESLEGAPRFVGDTFDCSCCTYLTSLEGAPLSVGNSFLCIECGNLKTLKGATPVIPNIFNCSHCNELTSLEGGPVDVGSFRCRECLCLTTLQGAPLHCKESFNCSFAPELPSLDFLPQPLQTLRIFQETPFTEPGPELLKTLWHNKTSLAITPQQVSMTGFGILYEYEQTGDLLKAMTDFEARYGVPLVTMASAPSSDIDDTLCL